MAPSRVSTRLIGGSTRLIKSIQAERRLVPIGLIEGVRMGPKASKNTATEPSASEADIHDLLVRKRIEQCLVAPVLLCTLLVLPYVIYRQISHGFKSTAWPKATGKILVSEVRETHYERRRHPASGPAEDDRRGLSPTYRPYVRYEYWVKGHRYEGENLAYIDDGSGKEWATGKIEKYPSQKKIIVRYHPLRPETSVLEAGAPERGILSRAVAFLSLELLLGFISFVFLLDIHHLNMILARRRPTQEV